MDDRLTNIQDEELMASERAGKFCYESGLVVPGKMDEDSLV
jgi:hypothetical protein